MKLFLNSSQAHFLESLSQGDGPRSSLRKLAEIDCFIKSCAKKEFHIYEIIVPRNCSPFRHLVKLSIGLPFIIITWMPSFCATSEATGSNGELSLEVHCAGIIAR